MTNMLECPILHIAYRKFIELMNASVSLDTVT